MPRERQNKSENFINRVQSYLNREKSNNTLQYSPQEYFTMLLQKGLETRMNGNYGIAAAYIVRSNGVEIIFFGPNSIISEGNPHGHAEMNATKGAVSLLQIPDDQRQSYLEQEEAAGHLIVRKAPHTDFETVLYTTLEPCPMCTVGAVINSGVQNVVVGTEDVFAGQLEQTRLSAMAPLWKQMADTQGLNVTFAQSQTPEDSNTFVPVELLNLLNDLFFQTKEPLDARLSQNAFLDAKTIGLIASAYLGTKYLL